MGGGGRRLSKKNRCSNHTHARTHALTHALTHRHTCHTLELLRLNSSTVYKDLFLLLFSVVCEPVYSFDWSEHFFYLYICLVVQNKTKCYFDFSFTNLFRKSYAMFSILIFMVAVSLLIKRSLCIILKIIVFICVILIRSRRGYTGNVF